jgi:hypothetical protein
VPAVTSREVTPMRSAMWLVLAACGASTAPSSSGPPPPPAGDAVGMDASVDALVALTVDAPAIIPVTTCAATFAEMPNLAS